MPKLVVPRWPRSATEGTEYQKDFKFCISCAEVYGGSSWAALKREVINPRFVTYIDICARGVLGNLSLSSVPTPTNTAALESIWSSLDRVASLSGYTTPARYRLHHRHNSDDAGADHSPRRCRVFLHHHVHGHGTKPAISCNVHTPHVFHQPDIFLNRSRQPEKKFGMDRRTYHRRRRWPPSHRSHHRLLCHAQTTTGTERWTSDGRSHARHGRDVQQGTAPFRSHRVCAVRTARRSHFLGWGDAGERE